MKSIEVFMAVARHGSFTSAADELQMSRAMVSKHIKALEAQLGVRLFNRNTRSINLTEEGGAYLARISPLMEALQDIESNIGEMAAKASGTLTVAAPTSFGVFHLSPLVASYMSRYPDVRLQLMLTDRQVNLVDEGVDMAIQIQALDDSSLVARQLTEVEMVTCASPAYLDRSGRPSEPADLVTHNCLVFAEIVQRRFGLWQFGRGRDRQEIRVHGDLVSNAGDALRMAALAGRGIVRLPSYMVKQDIEGSRLEPILATCRTDLRPVYAVYPHREFLSSKVRTFVDYLIDQFEQSP